MSSYCLNMKLECVMIFDKNCPHPHSINLDCNYSSSPMWKFPMEKTKFISEQGLVVCCLHGGLPVNRPVQLNISTRKSLFSYSKMKKKTSCSVHLSVSSFNQVGWSLDFWNRCTIKNIYLFIQCLFYWTRYWGSGSRLSSHRAYIWVGIHQV